MSESSTASLGIMRLVFVPALVTLAVTSARLAGELGHGPRRFFNPEAGGAWAIVGIIWLAPVFGIYFALKLIARGDAPKSRGRAVGFALTGATVVFALSVVGVHLQLQQHFRAHLLYVWIMLALAALVTWPGWPALFRTLLAYAYAARMPVALIMFFAFWGDWGTHYDALPSNFPESMGFIAKYLWLGFFAQLIFWVAVTVLAGMIFGSVAAALTQLFRRKSQRSSG